MGFSGDLEGMNTFPRDHLTVFLLAGILTSLVVVRLCRPWWRLRHIAGPFPASITNFQRMGWIGTKRAHIILQETHEKYGEVVRISPNMVSFSNPDAIHAVYPMRPGFPKVCTHFLSRCSIQLPRLRVSITIV